MLRTFPVDTLIVIHDQIIRNYLSKRIALEGKGPRCIWCKGYLGKGNSRLSAVHLYNLINHRRLVYVKRAWGGSQWPWYLPVAVNLQALIQIRNDWAVFPRRTSSLIRGLPYSPASSHGRGKPALAIALGWKSLGVSAAPLRMISFAICSAECISAS